MITRFRVENYACLADVEIHPGQVTLLSGRNGTGKTALALALDHLLETVREGVAMEELFSPQMSSAWSDRPDQRFELDLETHDLRWSYRCVAERVAERNPPDRLQERLLRDGEPIYVMRNGRAAWAQEDWVLPAPWMPARPASLIPGLVGSGWDQGRPFYDHLRRVSWYGMFQPDPFEQGENEERILDTWTLNFPAWYRYMARTRPEATAAFLDDLRGVLPGAVSLRDPLRPHELQLVLRRPSQSDTIAFRLDQLSSGEQKLVVLYALLHIELEPGVLLWLDDPVSGLYGPDARRWLTRLGDKVRAEGAQLILSTQHPEVGEALLPDVTVTLDRPEGGPTRARTQLAASDTLRATL